jgi:putative transposase
MPNYRRNFIPGGVYFFTVVTYRRRRILTDPLGRTALRHALRAVRSRIPFEINAMVLQPDHLHCVWTMPPGDADYPERWKQIKSAFTHEWLQSGGTELDVSPSRSKRGERS